MFVARQRLKIIIILTKPKCSKIQREHVVGLTGRSEVKFFFSITWGQKTTRKKILCGVLACSDWLDGLRRCDGKWHSITWSMARIIQSSQSSESKMVPAEQLHWNKRAPDEASGAQFLEEICARLQLKETFHHHPSCERRLSGVWWQLAAGGSLAACPTGIRSTRSSIRNVEIDKLAKHENTITH